MLTSTEIHIVRLAVDEGEITRIDPEARAVLRRDMLWGLKDKGFLEYKADPSSNHTEWRPTDKAIEWVERNPIEPIKASA